MGEIVRETARFVCSDSKHVQINAGAINRAAHAITDEELRKLSSPASFDAGN